MEERTRTEEKAKEDVVPKESVAPTLSAQELQSRLGRLHGLIEKTRSRIGAHRARREKIEEEYRKMKVAARRLYRK